MFFSNLMLSTSWKVRKPHFVPCFVSDCCIEMLPSLDNFLSYGADVFKARPDYRAKAFDIYQTAMTSTQLGDNDRINASKLAESILLNLQGHVDDVGLLDRSIYPCAEDSSYCKVLLKLLLATWTMETATRSHLQTSRFSSMPCTTTLQQLCN